jgi:hypothetical protein
MTTREAVKVLNTHRHLGAKNWEARAGGYVVAAVGGTAVSREPFEAKAIAEKYERDGAERQHRDLCNAFSSAPDELVEYDPNAGPAGA